MATIYTIHAPDAGRLEEVKADMLRLGAPTVRVVDCGDHYMALEGSHRIAAAHDLDIEPVLIVHSQSDEINITDFDWFDEANWCSGPYNAGEVAAELFSPYAARDYTF